MRKFNITVNGIAYEVEVEEVGAAEASAPAAAPAPVPAAAPKAAPAAPKAAPAAPKAAAPANGTKINAPMPGTILDEMENEILAPQDGTVAQVSVSKGASVNSGDVLVVLS